jgi:hypothetical protein
MSNRSIAILELWTNHRPILERHFQYIGSAIDRILPG